MNSVAVRQKVNIAVTTISFLIIESPPLLSQIVSLSILSIGYLSCEERFYRRNSFLEKERRAGLWIAVSIVTCD